MKVGSNPNRPVIAVSGSSGKTTVKEMISAILQRQWKIFKSKGNQNIPQCTKEYAKQITPAHRVAVLEYGMTRKGQIRKHCHIIQPNMGVITNVGTAHIGNFGGDIHKLALAKSELIRNMLPIGTLFLNADDANSKLMKWGHFDGKLITVGIEKKATYNAEDIRFISGGMKFKVKIDGKYQQFFIPIYGRHNIYNALFAIAVAKELKFSVRDMQKGLRLFQKFGARMSVFYIKNGIRLIDDTFSANPSAMKAAIDVLQHIGKGRKIAALGTMMEMGSYTKTAHRQVGSYAANKNIHYLLTYGQDAKEIGTEAVKNGLPPARVMHFTNRNSLHNRLLKIIEPNSTILIKGSHGMRMNQTVQFLRNTLKS